LPEQSLHEPAELLTRQTRNIHRALLSLMEELEAVDWYQQRADATDDAALKAILEHNRDEEIEHAMMVLEWIRRQHPAFDRHARTYLFTSAAITEIEEREEAAEAGVAPTPPLNDASLGVGSLRDAAPGGAGE
jgi:uncharacterized protein